MSALELEIPKGYLKTEYGIFPSDWSVLTLDDVCSFAGGAQPEKSVFSHKEQSGYIRLIQIRDYKSDKDIVYIPEKLARKKCLTTDIMIGRYGPPIFQILRGIEGAYNVALIKATPKENIEREFLYYFLKNDSLFELMDMLSQRSSGQTGVELPALKSYPIGLPTKKEQTAIANALSDVDALISELEKLIAKKQAIKTATMQQLLTGRTRLPQFALREDGTPKGTKPSELGEIPEDWEVLAMGDLGSTYGGLSGKHKQDFGHGNSLYVPFTNVMANVVVDVDNLEKVDIREAQNNLALGDLLFNGSSETPEEVCFAALVSADIRKLYLNSFCFGFRSNQKNAYSPMYLAYWFRSEVGRAAVSIMAQGSTRYNISKSQFMKLHIVLPDTEEQTAIATILSDMEAEIHALEQRLGKTRQIKQGMMQELLTGKTRLVQPSLTDVCHAD